MRAKEKEITDKLELIEIIKNAEICHLGLVDGDKPYILPMNFGYANNCIYFHCAKAGKKLELIKLNNNAVFSITENTQLKVDDPDVPCGWSMTFRSVIGSGKIHIAKNDDEVLAGLDAISNHYTKTSCGKSDYNYHEKSLKAVQILRLEITEMTGKRS